MPTDVGVSRPATVLVVEPDAVLRQFLRRLFERHGLEVLLTASPDEALVVLARAHGSVHAVVHTEALRFGAEQRETGHVAALSPDVPVVTFGGAAPGGSVRGGRLGGSRPANGSDPLNGERQTPGRGSASAARGTNGSRPSGRPFDAEELARAVLSAIARGR